MCGYLHQSMMMATKTEQDATPSYGINRAILWQQSD